MTLPISIAANPKVDLPHHRIHESRYFYVTSTAIGLPAGIPKDFIALSPPAAISLAHAIFIITVSPGAKFEIFEDTVVSNIGTPVPAINSNRPSGIISTGLVFEDPTIVSIGTKIWEELIGSTTTGGTGGPKNRNEDELVLKPLTNYLLRTTPLADDTLFSLNGRAYRQATAQGT